MRLGAHSRIAVRRWHEATALALLALLLLPINYRAGAATPHGHALIQLIHEARAGIPVHRHGADRPRDDHGGDVATSQTGAPAIQIVASSALLPLVLVALAIQTLRTPIRLVSDIRRAGRSLAPEHPPPQPVAAIASP